MKSKIDHKSLSRFSTGVPVNAKRESAFSFLAAWVFSILRKMKPIRQIEAAEHMVAGGTYTVPFAKALLTVTKPEMLDGIDATSKKLRASSDAARSMFEEENEFILRDLKSVEESYGTDVLTLTVSCGYLDRLLSNPAIDRYLARHHTDILQTIKTMLAESGRNAGGSDGRRL